MTTVWRWSGDGVAALHFGYLAYLIVGGFVAWRWPKSIIAHAVAAFWAILVLATPVPCPLTSLQEQFRHYAGQAPLGGGFVDIYIKGKLYPADRNGLVQVLVAVVVAGSWIGLAARHYRRARRRPGGRLPYLHPGRGGAP